MEQNAYWETDSHPVCQIPCLLWNLEVQYYITGPYSEPTKFSLHPYILFS
jgi:hypothetical protein